MAQNIATTIDQLPEELQLHIFAYLDSEAPSHVKRRHEPSLDLTVSTTKDIKNISLVSQRWRRIALPLLFRHARVRLDALPRPKWEECRGCLSYASVHWATSKNETSAQSDIATYHTTDHAVGVVTNDFWNANERLGTWSGLSWESRFFHRSDDFIRFVQRHSLPIESFVLYTGKLLQHVGRYPHRSPAAADRFKASAVLWQRLFSAIQPTRLLILAPPAELAYLTNAAVDLFGEWAFSDMDYHILELAVDPTMPSCRRPSSDAAAFALATLCYHPDDHGSIADASVLNLRPWTHLGLNEGSFLKAYGTYEYFERGPPSIVYSIKNCLTRHRRSISTPSPSPPTSVPAHVDDAPGPVTTAPSPAEAGEASLPAPTPPPEAPTVPSLTPAPPPRPPHPPLAHIRSFTYTAILPFATHLDFRYLLPQLEHLDVQIAPHASSDILNDRARVGKAELGDCWAEFFNGYRLLTRHFTTYMLTLRAEAEDGAREHRPPAAAAAAAADVVPLPRLKTFVCRDKSNPRHRQLREELDEEFIALCEWNPSLFLSLSSGFSSIGSRPE